MKREKIIILLTTFLLPLTFSPIVKAETRLVWSSDWEGMDVEVYAPYQAYPGDTITIRVRVEAKEDLQDVYVWVWLGGSKSEGYGTWAKYLFALSGVNLSTGVVRDQNFNVNVPSDASPGLVFSHTYCDWRVWRWPYWEYRSLDDSFRVTYLKNKAYEDLQLAYNDLLNDYDSLNSSYYSLLADYQDLLNEYDDLKSAYTSLNTTYAFLLGNYTQLQTEYDSLQSQHDDLSDSYSLLETDYNTLQNSYNSLETTYNSLNSTYNSLNQIYNTLQSEYDSLKSKHDVLTIDSGTARNLSYIFVITTIVFIATTAYFILRKPKIGA